MIDCEKLLERVAVVAAHGNTYVLDVDGLGGLEHVAGLHDLAGGGVAYAVNGRDDAGGVKLNLGCGAGCYLEALEAYGTLGLRIDTRLALGVERCARRYDVDRQAVGYRGFDGEVGDGELLERFVVPACLVLRVDYL